MIKMTIEVSPEQAIKIAELLSSTTHTENVQSAPVSSAVPVQQISRGTAAPTTSPAPAPAPAAAVPTAQTFSPVPTMPTAQPAAPTIPTAPTVPPVAARKYTMDELALASRPVCEAGRQAELLNLLHSFTFTDNAGNTQQVQSIQQLPEESYPAFANGIRALGGKI